MEKKEITKTLPADFENVETRPVSHDSIKLQAVGDSSGNQTKLSVAKGAKSVSAAFKYPESSICEIGSSNT